MTDYEEQVGHFHLKDDALSVLIIVDFLSELKWCIVIVLVVHSLG